MEEVLIFATILAPILTALVQLVKKTVKMPTNIVPALSFVIGIGLGAIAYPFTDLDLVLRLWAGGFAGLAATGLFEIGTKREGTTK
ncbi:holin [Bacillus velezensis]|uniref:holin n=1 Tax=Bacillus velezensis TaxID=492670 RepID=UPI000C9FAFB3|nr:holin [Bacillus velezensis]AUS14881.1 holin [Bacillus velezensis]URD63412.1 holin [Bacillus velezensis]WED87184.1 holin [Bacillus velezensis]WED89321.1 holin [Bacillus velezensis]WFB52501.1 holin [Bacillus velezensis]